MIELEVKLGSKTGLETVQNGEHAVVEVAPHDGSNQAPLVRVTTPPPLSGTKIKEIKMIYEFCMIWVL